MRSIQKSVGTAIAALLLAARARAVTKTVEVGPGGTLTFVDEESGTDTTTVTVGDTVKWVWQSSGHSTTRDEEPDTWDSDVQATPFSFTHRFLVPGNYAYHCTPHQFLGMTGTVVVQAAGTATTTTTLPPMGCDAEAVAGMRAQLEDQCHCATQTSHRAYVRCAARVVRDAVTASTLPRACTRAVKKCVAKSTCGRPGFVTCCRTTAAGRTTCSIKRSAVGCKKPKGGSACASTEASCCDACLAAGPPARPACAPHSTSDETAGREWRLSGEYAGPGASSPAGTPGSQTAPRCCCRS